MTAAPPQEFKPKDFASDQEVRWCPGCGDYAILKAVQKTLADIGVAPENTAFISGIGCSSRFPYYMATYGFHTIHGRAPAIATGLKLANPSLDVWVITGDGDALSIGGNHTLHVLRRNVDLQVILFNNEIYGLTKGQASPTSRIGTKSPSTPKGTVDDPLEPVAMALGAGARFVARAIDVDQKRLVATLTRAHQHRGASFVEVFQNCVVFNDDVFADFTKRELAADNQLHVEHGKPLLFGDDRSKGLRLRPGTLELEVVDLGDGGVAEDQILVHDERNKALAGLLAAMQPPAFPMALGVLYCDPGRSFEERNLPAELAELPDIDELVRGGPTWTVMP